MPKSRFTRSDVERFREEYLAWDKFGKDSETVEQLAKRLGLGVTTLYRLRNSGWTAPGGDTSAKPSNRNAAVVDLAPVVRYLTDELLAARAEIAELNRRLGEE